MFGAKLKNKVDQEMEPTRPVHPPWKEGDEAATWNMPRQHRCNGGACGGGVIGPSSYLRNKLVGKNDEEALCELIFNGMPVSMFEDFGKQTQHCANEEWVHHVERLDKNGVLKHKKCLRPCERNTPGARHCQKGFGEHRNGKKINRTCSFATGFLICWMGALFHQGAKVGA